jgi:hypothetical protein
MLAARPFFSRGTLVRTQGALTAEVLGLLESEGELWPDHSCLHLGLLLPVPSYLALGLDELLEAGSVDTEQDVLQPFLVSVVPVLRQVLPHTCRLPCELQHAGDLQTLVVRHVGDLHVLPGDVL